MLALVPELLGPIPGAESYSDIGDVDRLDEVEFYVPVYMGDEMCFRAMSAMPALRTCQLLTAGYEQALAFLPAGVALCNAAGVHDASASELAVGLILASLRGIDDFARAMPEGRWLHSNRPALADRRIVIVGAGGLGSAIARRLEPFDVSITMVASRARAGVRGIDELADLLHHADVVVIALPLTDQTRGMFDASLLGHLRNDSLVVNVGRGQVLDSSAVMGEVGRLRFALDVTDPEPLPADHPLWTAPGVLISPHVGGNTSAFVPRARSLVAAQVERAVTGQPLVNVVGTG